jgi:hypothetical protein
LALTQVNTGTYNMDASGTRLRNACSTWNTNFAALFAGTGLTPQVINVGPQSNTGTGDSAYVIFTKCNANFAALSALPAFVGLTLEVVNVGSAAINKVIGLADPGVLACRKVNYNFAVL